MRFKELLAATLLVGILAMLTAAAVLKFDYPEIALGAFIAWGTLIVQYYWRKKDPT